MIDFGLDWLNLLLRWAHIIVGIGWIGTSFYFMALDYSLRRRERMKPGVLGTAWQVHGGGFYHVEKFTVVPDELPVDLKWFRWEAYLTWVTGFALLVVQYYVNANAYLIDPAVMPLTTVQAVFLSVASLGLGWLIYDAMCTSKTLGSNPRVLGVAVTALILAFTYLFTEVFSGRGALIHVGAFIGTIMAVNVFGVIVPNQKKITASLLKGEAPDPALGKIGKQRSTHNNYLTLPVLLMMVSGHYPMLTGHDQAWLLVALILAIGASVRHYINRHDAGDEPKSFAWTLPAATVGLAIAVVITAPRVDPAIGSLQVADTQALSISLNHCSACHAANPTHEFFAEAPGGVRLETVDDLRRHAGQVWDQAVISDLMPLGNETGMTDAERRQLGAWIQAQR